MFSIHQVVPFSSIKEFYIPAIHHPIFVGKKKMYSLSIPLGGREIVIKRSSKKIIHTSFAQVIVGAILRMKKLFLPDKIKVGVILNRIPNENDLTFEFELVNTNRFKIGDEDYILSISVSYSYTKADKVSYCPILYRQICGNGAVAILNEQFKEIVPVEKIMEVGCEWSRCNFETYKNQTSNYFELLRSTKVNPRFLLENAEKLVNNILGLKEENRRSDRIRNKNYISEIRSVSQILSKYFEVLGSNQFAFFNTLTEFASQEESYSLRYQYFKSIGIYLSKEIKKTAKINDEKWLENLDWNDLNNFIN